MSDGYRPPALPLSYTRVSWWETGRVERHARRQPGYSRPTEPSVSASPKLVPMSGIEPLSAPYQRAVLPLNDIGDWRRAECSKLTGC